MHARLPVEAGFLSEMLPLTMPDVIGGASRYPRAGRAPRAVAHPAWTAALDAVLAVLRTSGGIVLLQGAPGTGKTRLLQEVARVLRAEGRPVVMPSATWVGGGDSVTWDGSHDAAVLVDEADRLDPEAVGVLVRDGTDGLVLAGVAFPRVGRALLAAGALEVSLLPLRPSEVPAFLAERLEDVGLPRDAFPDDVAALLATRSGGVPRVLAMLADASHALADLDGAPRVRVEDVQEAASLREGAGLARGAPSVVRDEPPTDDADIPAAPPLLDVAHEPRRPDTIPVPRPVAAMPVVAETFRLVPTPAEPASVAPRPVAAEATAPEARRVLLAPSRAEAPARSRGAAPRAGWRIAAAIIVGVLMVMLPASALWRAMPPDDMVAPPVVSSLAPDTNGPVTDAGGAPPVVPVPVVVEPPAPPPPATEPEAFPPQGTPPNGRPSAPPRRRPTASPAVLAERRCRYLAYRFQTGNDLTDAEWHFLRSGCVPG